MKTYNYAPYYDDFDVNKKFYRILFRPGYAVQARELTQLQTILHNQIKNHGDSIFKEGAMVIPGQSSIDTSVGFVKLQTTSADVTKFISSTVSNTSGLDAHVVHAVPAEGTDPATLFVRYTTSGGTDNTVKVFANNEVLSIGGTDVITATSNATGLGSIATIERGIYYVGGNFVLCDAQSIVLDKYTNTPNYRIGLKVTESTIIPEQDPTLLDNAQGSSNYAAPGAHRYFIDLTLTKLASSDTGDDHFIELVRVIDGQINRIVNKTEYSELEKTLARRTFDESGNYTVRPFAIDIREHRDNNRGPWVSGTQYLIGDVVTSNGNTYVAKRNAVSVNIAPSHVSGTSYDGAGNTGVQWEYNETPHYTRGVFKPEQGGSESKLAVGLEPGKAYVQGYEIEKIATEYVTVDKSRESVLVDNAIIPATVGNYVMVINLNGAPPINTFAKIDLYDRLTTTVGSQPGGTKIGTARARFIEWDSGTIGTQTALYKVGIFDVQLNPGYNFSRDVKSLYYNVGGNPKLSFSADINPVLTRLVGSATANGTTISGTGTSFQTDLKVNDYVSFAGSLRRVVSINSQNEIVVDQSTTATGSTVDRVSTTILEPNNISLIYQLPYFAIKSVRSENNTNDTTYTVYERLTANAGPLSGATCSMTMSTTSGTFASAADNDNYIFIDNNSANGGGVVPVTSGNIVVSGSTATVTLPGTYAGRPFIIIAAINKSGSVLTEKAKTLRLAGESGTVITKTTPADATLQSIMLGRADCYRLVSVKMKPGTFASPGANYSIDITDRYDFDSGQRDTHYDIGRINLKSSYQPPSAPIQITFEYFVHGPGDYFTVNSYGDYSTATSNTTNIAYASIPFYKGVSLGDCFDFRPRISDDGTGFVNAGTVSALVPKRGVDIRADYRYYLSRKTKIAVDFNGKFFAIDGVSSLTPGEPLDPSMGMVLYSLTLEPYTFSSGDNSVVVVAHDNKRYTMRDIGKLEKRIDNLEYYTSLSLLEQQTESIEVIDDVGDNRFKNGFIVDGFSGHNTGDTGSPDYLCAIDMENAELRPFYSMQNINIIEKNTADAQRAASNYKVYGDVITLPVVDQLPLVKQEYASRLENINPFAIFTFLGQVQLNPASDDWFEVNRRPDIVNQVEGNFNTIKTLAEKAGVLGTVWNAWQTQWSGVSSRKVDFYTAANPRWGNGVWANQRALGQGASQLTLEQMNARFGQGGNFGAPSRQVMVETVATQVGQTRTGTRSTVVAKIDRQVVADRVLSTAAIPYIRSRNILVQVKGLKPNTRFYPFFDNVDVGRQCIQAFRVTYIPGSRVFDDSTNVGGMITEEARRMNGDTQICLNRGDVIRGSVSGATGVVVGKEYNADTNTYALYILNHLPGINQTFITNQGYFRTGDELSGSLSGASGTFVKYETWGGTEAGGFGSALYSNFSGDLQLVFKIPNTDSLRFRTGSREFKLVDTNQSDGEFTSRGRATYRAEGVLETRQSTINAVRNGEIVEEQVRDNNVIVQTSSRVVSDTGWYDPLAQTFLVQQRGGAFITKIDIFFATKDPKIPVNIEIREVVNGYPGKIVLPFSRVSLKPEQVKLSTTYVDLDGVSYPKYDTATPFVFPSPVYVQDNAEYAIVLSSDSNNYKVWISQLGDQIPGSTRTISQQPYNGVFFKSQNASTWTADQMQDLKFTIYRAKFDTNVIGNVEFVNDVVPFQDLDFDPFETRVGSLKVRVYQPNHGMPVGSRVTIANTDNTKTSGLSGTGTITTSTTSTAITGNSTLLVQEAQIGSTVYNSVGQYIGVIQSIASNSGTGAMTLVSNAAIAINNGAFKIVQPINGIPAAEIYKTHVISDVDADSYTIAVGSNPTTTGYAGGLTVRSTRNYQFDSFQPSIQLQTFPDTTTTFGIKSTTGKSPDSTSQVPYLRNPNFEDALANENNVLFNPAMIASEVNEANLLGGNKSLTMNVTMTTTNDAVSPVLDTQRMSLIIVNNKVNSPTQDNVNVGGLDSNVIVSNSSLVSISGQSVVTSDPALQSIFKTVKIGKYLTIAGATSGESTRLITTVASDGSTITFDTAPDPCVGNITLTQQEMFVDEISPQGSSSFSKYLTKKVNLANTSTFMRIRFAASIPAEAGVEVYYRTQKIGSTSSIEELNYTKLLPDTPITFVQNGSDQFVDVTCSTGDIDAFNAVQVKLVMKSSNTSAVPRIKDLRVIACA